MNPALIDAHTRLAKPGDKKAIKRIAERGVEEGLDGAIVFAHQALPTLPKKAPKSFALFVGLELDSDIGRLLVLPRDPEDSWFGDSDEGWRSVDTVGDNGALVFDADAMVRQVNERGGIVLVAQPFDTDLSHPTAEDAFAQHRGLGGVVVASDPKHESSNTRASEAAVSARLACVAGSASAADEPRFGSVATVFALPPTSQQALVDCIRAGRVWAAEIAPPPDPKAERKAERKADASPDEGEAHNGAQRDSKQRDGKRGRKSKRDPGERPGDNRGNRLDSRKLRGRAATPWDDKQPEIDPIAKLYGLHDRKADRFATMSDEELDRINGNRARGSDPNRMREPDFTDLRAEREHVSLLLRTIDDQADRQAQSISLRFALSYYADGKLPPPPPKQAGGRRRRGNSRRRRG